MTAAILIAVVLSVPFIITLATRPTLRRLAVRNASRRPRESALVVLGSLLATALITAAFVVGDTFGSSIRNFAYTQLGPVDEIVAVVGETDAAALRQRLAGFEHPDVDGVLEISTKPVAAATTVGLDDEDARTAAPKAQLIEIDFERARLFGGDANATGISGPTPEAGTSVLAQDLADKLAVRAGDEFTVFASGASTTLTVDRVIEQKGIAGFWLGFESKSFNAFVAPGTIADLTAAASEPGEPPSFGVAISNRGGVESGAGHSETVAAALVARLDGLAANVNTIKADLIEQADEAGTNLTTLYGGISAFAVFAGILLMVNIFLMLAQERRSELGMMRAMGLRRGALVMGFAGEGWLYAVVASALGTVVGLLIARLVAIGAAGVFGGSDDFALDLVFTYQTSSLAIGFLVGLGIAVLTILGTSIGTAFFNVIAAIRGIEEERQQRRRGLRIATGALLVILGIGILVGGLSQPQATPILLGFPIAVFGLYVIMKAGIGRRRWSVTTAAATVLAWSVIGVSVAVARGAELDIDAFVTQGVTGVLGAVALITEYQNEIGRLLARFSRGSLTVRLGLAYPLARRARTAFTIGQFAIVVFILVYISVLAHMFGGQVDGFTRDISGGYDAFVESSPANPIPVEELSARSGVRGLAPLTRLPAEITTSKLPDSKPFVMASFDDRWIEGGAPALESRGEYATDEAAYRAVLENPNYAMVDEFFLSDGGPPAAAIKVGDTFTVTDPVSGNSAELTVIAQSADDLLRNGGLMNPDAMRELFGERAVPNRLYIATDDPEALARELEAEYFSRGAQADSLHDLVAEFVAQQNQFFWLMRSFLAIGLVIGIAGIGVIMVRAVRERRRQIGILRALGFQADSVSGAFAIEAAFLSVEGTVVGVLLGFVCSWSITTTDDFGAGLKWGVPWGVVILLVTATVVGALLATLGPARAASKIRPSVALRITD